MTTTKKNTQLTQGIIHSVKLETKNTITVMSCTSSFDQRTAEAVGVKDSIYDEQGMRRGGLNEWGINQESFGSTVSFTPHQKTLFGDKILRLKAVKLDLEKVLEQDADGKLKMSFKVTLAGYPRDLFDFLEAVKKGECGVVIEPPAKNEEDDAKIQASNFGLFAIPKVPKGEGDGEKPEKNKKKETEEVKATETPAAVEPDATPGAGAIASAREMGATRGRKRPN